MYVVGLFSKDLCNVSKHVFQDFPYLFSPRHDHYKKPGYAIFFSISVVNVMYCKTIIYKKINFSLPKSSIIHIQYVVYPVLPKDMIMLSGIDKIAKN